MSTQGGRQLQGITGRKSVTTSCRHWNASRTSCSLRTQNTDRQQLQTLERHPHQLLTADTEHRPSAAADTGTPAAPAAHCRHRTQTVSSCRHGTPSAPAAHCRHRTQTVSSCRHWNASRTSCSLQTQNTDRQQLQTLERQPHQLLTADTEHRPSAAADTGTPAAPAAHCPGETKQTKHLVNASCYSCQRRQEISHLAMQQIQIQKDTRDSTVRARVNPHWGKP